MGIASLSSHGRVLTEIKDGLLSRVSTAASTTDVDVHLVEGMQAGQTRTLKLSSLTIGASSGSDVVLLDEKIADRHVQVTFSRSAFGMLAMVESYNAGVAVNGEALPMGGEPFEVTLPFDMTIGAAKMRFQRPGGSSAVPSVPDVASAISNLRAKETPKTTKRRMWQVDPMVMLGVSGLGFLLIGGLMLHLVGDRKNFVVDVNAPSFAETQSQRPDSEWLVDARDQVAALGLEKALTVNVLSNNILRTSGQIPEAQVGLYRELQTWFDGQAGAPSMVWDVQQRARLASLPNIGMVRISDPAAVVLTSGAEITIGQELVDGWVLSEIDNTMLSLTRGLETHQINYRADAE